MDASGDSLPGLFAAVRETSDPNRAAARVVAALQGRHDVDAVAVWRTDRAEHRLRRAGLEQSPTLQSVADLPTLPGAMVIPIARFDVELGALELVGEESARTAADHAASLLSLHFSAVRVAEDYAQEVAERSRAVEQAWQFASLIIDSLPVGLYVVDAEYRIRIWNRKRETGMQGLHRRDTVGRSVFDVLTRQGSEALRAEFDAVLVSGEARETELTVETPDGPRVYRQTRLPMRLESEAVTHVITIGEDITAWRRIQERILQSEKLASIGQLAAGTMHEINNPLATISGAASAIEYRLDVQPLDLPGLREYAALIEREVGRCTRIVRGLLDFSRPAAHVRGKASLNRLVEDTLQLVRHHERFRRVTLDQTLEPRLPMVMVNGEQLIQVLMALCLNALDAMADGGRLTIRTGRSITNDREVFVSVADTGTGIAPRIQARIFDPFFTTKSVGRGTGLGLSICYGLVEAHHGRIEVQSEPGRGSVFSVLLPIGEESA